MTVLSRVAVGEVGDCERIKLHYNASKKKKKQPVRVDKEPKMGDTKSLLALSGPIDKTGRPDFTHFPVNEEFKLATPPVIYSCCVRSYGVDFGFIFVALASIFIVDI